MFFVFFYPISSLAQREFFQLIAAQYPALGDKIWYFFSPKYRKYLNGYQPNRAAGDGYWKATGANKPVDHKDQVVGLKKALIYYEGKLGHENSKKTNWIMQEFLVEGPPRIKKNQNDMKVLTTKFL